jgi:nitrogen fixation protein NifU and related proteins
MDETIYQENILDHYRHPRNFGVIPGANAKAKDSNPLCGDEIEIRMKVVKGRIAGVKFSGHACAICTASASMLTEKVSGKKLDEALKIGKDDVLSMVGVPLSAVRVKCALLALKVLKMAGYSYLGKKLEWKEDD